MNRDSSEARGRVLKKLVQNVNKDKLFVGCLEKENCRRVNKKKVHALIISAIRQLIPESAVAQIVHSAVTSRLDCCNSLLYSLPDWKTKQLQRIQNTGARVVTCTPCTSQQHITEVLKDLHWLPVKKRVIFKILLLTYKCVNNLSPKYLCELLSPRKCPRPLRSDSLQLLEPPKTRLKSYGGRSFAYGADDTKHTHSHC